MTRTSQWLQQSVACKQLPISNTHIIFRFLLSKTLTVSVWFSTTRTKPVCFMSCQIRERWLMERAFILHHNTYAWSWNWWTIPPFWIFTVNIFCYFCYCIKSSLKQLGQMYFYEVPIVYHMVGEFRPVPNGWLIVLPLSIPYSTDKSLLFVLLVLVLLESRSSNGRLSGWEALGRVWKSCSDKSCASVKSFGIKILFRNYVFLPIWVLVHSHALASKRRRPIVRRYCDGTSTDCRKRRHLVLLREMPSASWK